MKIGIPAEIKVRERRVAMTPSGIRSLTTHGHEVLVEKGAGSGSGMSDDAYRASGATLVDGPLRIWDECQMVIKVKEPVGPELDRMKKSQVLFTYLHLAANEELTEKLVDSGVTAIAYETMQTSDGFLPLLAPMSEIAGRLAVQMGCSCLEAKNGGKGLLLSGVPGVPPAKVAIIGGGIAGHNAAHLAVGMGAQVTILDMDIRKLRYLDDVFRSRAVTVMSNPSNVEDAVCRADLVICSVLIPGARAPRIITRDMLVEMEDGSAIVDISIDQGGCAETSRPTTHDDPFYTVENVVHYCVSNMPGAVPKTSTFALTNATLPFICTLADLGVEKALGTSRTLLSGLNVYDSAIVNENVAQSFGYAYTEPEF